MKTARLIIEGYGCYHKVHPHPSSWTYELRTIFKILSDLKEKRHWRINNMQ